MRKAALLFCLMLLATTNLATNAVGQNTQSYLNDIGSTAYGVNIPVQNGFINVSNGNLHLEFSLAAPQQRGALTLNERIVYDSRIWMFSKYSTNWYHWWPYNIPNTSTTSGGWQFIRGDETGSISLTTTSYQTGDCQGDGVDGHFHQTQSQLSWIDPLGTIHPTQALLSEFDNECTQVNQRSITQGNATDGSGYVIADDGNGSPVVTDIRHMEVYPQVIDQYGNYFSVDGQGNLQDDTGRVPVIVTRDGNKTYYDVTAPNGTVQNSGTRVRYTVTTASVPVSTNFQQSATHEWTSSNLLTPVQAIQLPDGSTYSFTYDDYGEMSSMTLPTGGVISYGYGNFLDSANTENRWLESMKVGSNPAMTFTPLVGTNCADYSNGCKEYITVKKPSGDTSIYELTLANGAWNTAEGIYTGTPPPCRGPIPRCVRNNAQTLINTTTTYTYSNACSGPACAGANYITSSLQSTELFANGSPSVFTQTQSTFDSQSGKPLSEKTWDYAPDADMNTSTAPTTTPLRETDYTYSGLDLESVKVKDATGTQVALTMYGYNGTLVATSGLPQHGSQNAGWIPVQSVTQWLNTDPSHSSTTTYTVDDSGMVMSVTDPNHRTTTTSYQCANSLPYQSKNALQQMTQFGYDCSSGAITSIQDPNDLAAARSGTTYAYEPTAGRINTETRPDGGITTYTYPSTTEVDTSVTATPSPTVVTASIADAFGRPSQTTSANISVETSYDANGRPYCTTNPHIVGQPNGTDGRSCIISYDGLDRPLVQQQADGSTRQTSYSSNSVTSSDERGTGNVWVRTADALGRLTSVAEPGPGGSAATLTTNYTYDLPGNATSVVQHGIAVETARTRMFSYDSLGRLLWSQTPEAGVTCYGHGDGTVGGCNADGYDLNGNLLHRTDGAGILVNYDYDELNRLKAKWSPNNIDYSYTYDHVPNGIGQLYKETSGSVAGTIFIYDAMGRVSSTQWFKNSEYASPQPWKQGMGLQYDLAGNATQLTYPNGMVLQQAWDTLGRLQSVTDTTPGGAGTVYFGPNGTGAQYGPAGPLQEAKLGNGVVEQMQVNNRLQPCRFSAASSVGGTLLDRHLFYHPAPFAQGEDPCTQPATGNNGSIWSIAEENGGEQDFGYDQLNRLTSAFSANRPANSSNYDLAYHYDSFGNMRPADNLNGSLPYWIDDATNQLKLGANDMQYYGNGWLWKANGHEFWYSAEGYLWGVDQFQAGSYRYNALNERTMTVTPGAWDEYVYLNGQAMADITNAGQWTDYVYANGQKIARVVGNPVSPSKVSYYLSDHLGTAQMELDASGAPTWKGWFTPFGQEITSGSWAPNYIGPQPPDGTDMRFKFTGLERDQETGLDHAAARSYAPPFGRWMSPDPYDGSMDFSDPQSFNRYSYVGSMPLNFTDPSGLEGGSVACLAGVQAAVICGGIVVFDYFLTKGIAALFAPPTFKASHTPRPSARDQSNWLNSDTFSVPYQGLLHPYTPGQGCEFGGCNFQQGSGPPGGAVTDILRWGAGYALNGLNDLLFIPADRPAPRRYFGTYYCGPGGAGPRTGLVNGACAAHDDCFTNAKINADGNTNKSIYWSPAQVAMAKSCNQALYNTLKGSDASGATLIQAWLLWGDRYGILRPGTTVTR